MENNGKVNISGYINPTLLLKCLEKAGKTAEIVHWQYGECSRNLFEKPKLPSPSVNNNNLYLPGYEGYNNNGYYGYNYNNGYGYGYGYPPNYRRSNYVFNHLECSGNASDCSGHHMRNPNTPNKSSSSSSSSKTQFQKPASGHIGNHPTCCSLMWRISWKYVFVYLMFECDYGLVWCSGVIFFYPNFHFQLLTTGGNILRWMFANWFLR